jgi:hypothetical protein
VKNINSTHRVEGINSQYGLSGALAASNAHLAAKQGKDGTSGLEEKVRGVLRTDS